MVDGVDAVTIRSILESQIQITSKRHKEGIAILIQQVDMHLQWG